MNRSASLELTASQEDYLEAIWNLIWREGVARVSDIAEQLGVSMPSVSGALKTLDKLKLVEYTPHKYVTLSDKGMELAQNVSARHGTISKFLTEILDIEDNLADSNACRIEHAVDEVVSKKMSYFVNFISQNDDAKKLSRQFVKYCKKQEADAIAILAKSDNGKTKGKVVSKKRSMTLLDVKPGQKAKIVRVNTTQASRRRLAVMGMTRNEIISVVRIAPLGDPIEVKIRGYSLSLRKTQAGGIEVESIE